MKGVGIVIDNTSQQIESLGTGVSMRWVWSGYENTGKIDDKYNVRNNTLYEEFNNTVQNYVLNLIFKKMK